jgi:hypothetical protein
LQPLARPEHFIVIEERLKAMDAMDRGWIPVHLGFAQDGVTGPLPDLVGSYLGPLLASFFLISGLSYKTTFNRELRISSLPLYSI